MSNGIQKSNGEVIFSQDLSVQIFYIGMSLPGPEDSINFFFTVLSNDLSFPLLEIYSFHLSSATGKGVQFTLFATLSHFIYTIESIFSSTIL